MEENKAHEEINSYESAMNELDEILEKMESEEISVDELAVKVERASKLLVFCNDKLKSTEVKVNKIIEDLDL